MRYTMSTPAPAGRSWSLRSGACDLLPLPGARHECVHPEEGAGPGTRAGHYGPGPGTCGAGYYSSRPPTPRVLHLPLLPRAPRRERGARAVPRRPAARLRPGPRAAVGRLPPVRAVEPDAPRGAVGGHRGRRAAVPPHEDARLDGPDRPRQAPRGAGAGPHRAPRAAGVRRLALRGPVRPPPPRDVDPGGARTRRARRPRGRRRGGGRGSRWLRLLGLAARGPDRPRLTRANHRAARRALRHAAHRAAQAPPPREAARRRWGAVAARRAPPAAPGGVRG